MRYVRWALWFAVIALCGFLAGAARATTYTVQYGDAVQDYAVVHPGGVRPLLLLHGAEHTVVDVEGVARQLRRDGFTVLNLEWAEDADALRIWDTDVAQIEGAIAYARGHASELGVDAARLTMVGGSRGANLTLLASENVNAVAPGTVRAIGSLSGDADPARQIERGQRGEITKAAARRISGAYGCEPVLVSCPAEYVAQWSPYSKAASSAPAEFLAASVAEHTTASLADQYELAGRLGEVGVDAEVVAPPKGHAFGYWAEVRARTVAFLVREAG